jgi:hypothetical protein
MDGWVGLQKLITVLDMKNGYKGGVRVGFICAHQGRGEKERRGGETPWVTMILLLLFLQKQSLDFVLTETKFGGGTNASVVGAVPF